MKIDQNNWLPHLKYLPQDIKGYKTCTYFMALEGWRRGLNLKFHIKRGVAIPPSIRYSLSDGKKQHFFVVARGDKVTKSAINTCMNKPQTYKSLSENQIPIPEGTSFDKDVDDSEIIKYAKKLDFPLVIKPTDGKSGIGVITDIKNLKEFTDAMEKVRYKLGFKDVIVERFIKGDDYRVYVVADKVVGIYKRIEANVIGNGESTINKLISNKNKIRKSNPFIYNRPIQIDSNLKEYLKGQKLTLDSIPEKGKRIYLRSQGEYLKERDPVDITDIVSDEIKDIAVRAMQSIPGLTHCDVDMLVNEEEGKAYVNEINSRPQISNHLFPLEGKARDIPKEIIDYYFPETKNKARNDNLYFDFQPVFEGFRNMSMEEFSIPNIPMDHTLMRYRLKGTLKNVGFERWLKRQVGLLKMNGYIKHLKNGETSINLSGKAYDFKRLEMLLESEIPRGIKIKELKVYKGNRPVTIGFENKKLMNSREDFNNQIKKLKQKQIKLENEITKITLDYDRKLKQYNNLIKTKSWRFTKVFRGIGRIFKGKR